MPHSADLRIGSSGVGDDGKGSEISVIFPKSPIEKS